MLNVGPAELLMILIVALLVLGPKKLPEAARQLGKAMSEFRRVSAGLQDEVRGVLDEHFEAVDAVSPVPPTPPATPVPATSTETTTGTADGNGAAPQSDPLAPPPE